jgi:hypothetical protein
MMQQAGKGIFFLFSPFLIIILEMNPVKHFFQIWPFLVMLVHLA